MRSEFSFAHDFTISLELDTLLADFYDLLDTKCSWSLYNSSSIPVDLARVSDISQCRAPTTQENSIA
jgi:hypothetical protein